MKKSISILVVGIVALGMGFMVASGRFSKPDEKLLVKVNVYQNEQFGLSFSYPDRYVVTEKEVGDAHRRHYSIVLIEKVNIKVSKNGEGPTAITVDMYQNNLDKQSIVSWLKNSNESNFKLSDGKYASTTVDGGEAIHYKRSGLYEGETVALDYEDSILAFSVTYLTLEDRIRKDFEEVLKSVKFEPRQFSEEQVLEYLKTHISELSPQKEVLGGKFYITAFEFTGRSTGLVSYEDGHNAFNAEIEIARDNSGNIAVQSFTLK